MRVTLKPLGAAEPSVLEHLRTELRRFGEVEIAPPGSLLPAAFDEKKARYRAGLLLPALAEEPGDIVLAVTADDLYEPGLNFVFGLGQTRGRTAIISTARLGGDGRGMLFERSLKEAVHEIGHVLGLDHDRNPDCVMFFSNNLADTDRKDAWFCPRCEAAAAFILKRLGR